MSGRSRSAISAALARLAAPLRYRLGPQLLATVVVSFALIVGGMQLIYLYGMPGLQLTGDIERATREQHLKLSLLAQNRIALLRIWIEEWERDAGALSAMVERQLGKTPRAHLQGQLDAFLRSHLTFKGITVAAPGRVLLRAGVPMVPDDWLFAQIPEAGAASESFFRLAGEEGNASSRLALFHPLRDGSGRWLVLTGGLRQILSTTLLLDLPGGTFGETLELHLVGRDGQLLSNRRFTAPGAERIATDTASVLAGQGFEGTIVAPDYRGVNTLAAFRHLSLGPEFGIGLVAKIDADEALAPVHQRTTRTLVFGTIALLLFLPVVLLLIRRLTQPLGAVTRAVERIAQGDLSARSGVTGRGEIARLGETLDGMAARIEESRRVLDDALHAQADRLMEQETRLSVMAEMSLDAIIITDSEHRILFANPATGTLLGQDTAALTGRSLENACPPGPGRLPCVSGLFEAAMTGAQMAPTTEAILRRSDGRDLVVEVSISPFATMDGLHAAGILRDITERKRREAEQMAREQKLRDAQRLESLGVLAGGVAHDFNNLLTTILGNATLARHDLPPGSPVPARLNVIEDAAQRAAQICRLMLSYAGKTPLAQELLDLNDLVQSVQPLLEASVPSSIELRVRLPDGPALMHGDAAQLHQIVMNLVTNASEAIGTGSGKISIGVEVEGDRRVRLEVADDGCGMSAEVRERLFEPFFSTKFAGRGLGMAAVHGLVNAHGGSIEVDSAPGKGTRISVRFPPPPAARPAVGAPAASSAPLDGQGTVLVADDETGVRLVLTDMLEALGHRVVACADGTELLHRLPAIDGVPVVAVLDLTMPGMGPREIVTGLRERHPALPVLFVTGHDPSEVFARVPGVEGIGALQKPFTAADLAAALGALTTPM